MGFAAVPGRDDALFMIAGFYPIFRGEAAGVTLIRAVNRFDEPWTGERIAELPFVHRISSVSTNGGDFLVGATICGGKDSQDDWSRPGAVYAFEIGADQSLGPPATILPDIHRNHGMALGSFRGVRSLLISSDEGVFALAFPGEADPDGHEVNPWETSVILDHAVSEIAQFDFDSDGVDELAVIEPFHGDELAVYKDERGTWNKIFSAKLEFGHGLSAGMLLGQPVIVVGNRVGTKDLVCFRFRTGDPIVAEREVVEMRTGTAGTTIIETPWGEGIAASNPENREYAFYVAKRE